jgi:threonine dehydrogenase-like Zn-dependent dehydrogenase
MTKYKNAACAEGKTNCCENVSLYGVYQDGGFCEYLAVLESNLVKVNSNLSDSTVALTECFAIGAAAIAKAHGANVVVADVKPSRQAHVESTLNIKAVNPLSNSFEADLRTQFSGELADGELTPFPLPRSAERAGLVARENRTEFEAIPELVFPAVLLLRGGDACVLVSVYSNMVK